MKNLILLAALAAATIAVDQPALEKGATLTDVPDDVADKLIADKLAELAPKAGKPAKQIKARVLIDSVYGKCNDVVALDAATAKEGEASGQVDTAPAAVAYAESLKAA